jgi:hypothetical protein
MRTYLAEIGKLGGKKSRRTLTKADARRMVLVREARRAYSDFHAQCFWSNPVDFKPGPEDIPWIADRLRKYGGMTGWRRAQRLCLSATSR